MCFKTLHFNRFCYEKLFFEGFSQTPLPFLETSISKSVISLKCIDISMLWTTHDIGLRPTGVGLNSLWEICPSFNTLFGLNLCYLYNSSLLTRFFRQSLRLKNRLKI